MKKELELYLHIPFCVRKCHYCDFLSSPASPETISQYCDALGKETEIVGRELKDCKVSTIFIGGGTPSILLPEQTVDIMSRVRKHFTIMENAEISMEVNPGTVTEEKAIAWKNAGINRISLGLQSCNDEELKNLGRIHTYEEFLQSFAILRGCGFQNLNVDLMSALPGQTLTRWEQTLRSVAQAGPEHISAYSLIIEEGTAFYERYNEDAPGYFELPDEDTDREMYRRTKRILSEYGYSRYEISNYAKEGYACRHNVGYWRRTPYIGLGLGASSFFEEQRFKNTDSLEEYVQACEQGILCRKDQQILTKEDAMEEFMFLGLRMMEGISYREFEHHFQISIDQVYQEPIRRLKDAKLLKETPTGIALTEKGIDISNYVFTEFLFS